MPTSKLGYVVEYGFAAVTVLESIYSMFSNDTVQRATKRGYILY